MTITGAWQGGSGMLFTQHIYRDGNFLGTADLRVPFASITTEENEGATASGVDSKTVAYNNAAGTSYQFKARTTAQGEALGFVAYAPAGACTPAPPTSGILQSRTVGLHLSASQAQCRTDPISFSSDVDLTGALTLSGLTVTIYNAMTGAEVATFNQGQMYNTNAAQVYYFSTVLAPGPYTAVAQADIAGIGSVDLFDSAAVNVPVGPCTDTPTDLSPVLLAIASLNFTTTANFTIVLNAIHNLNNTVIDMSGNQTIDVNLHFPASFNTTVNDTALQHWLPLAAVAAIVILAVRWSNPILTIAGLLGFIVYEAKPGPITEVLWLFLALLGIIVPNSPSCVAGMRNWWGGFQQWRKERRERRENGEP